MTRPAALHVVNRPQLVSTGSDAYLWQNPNGGFWNVAANWWDTTTGTIAATVPASTNAVTITGGSDNNFTNVAGTGAAAQLAINNDVLLWGTLAVAGTATLSAAAEFDLDGGASLTAAALTLGTAAGIVTGGASTVRVSGTTILTGSVLTTVGGSAEQTGMLIGNTVNNGFAIQSNLIAVDDISSLEIGSAGNAALGAITVDPGLSPAISGTLYGNVVANGTLAVQANGSLSIDPGDPYGTAHAISGTGALLISEDSLLTLGIVDSAAIRFGGPVGTLDLIALPTGTVSGFTNGDIIELAGGTTVLATSLSYTQTSNTVATLTLMKGGTAAGTLILAGNYTGDLFHLSIDAHGDGLITLQTIGIAPVQPSLIMGTAGTDAMFATAASQTLTGLGGNDTLDSGDFAGIDFKDTSTDLNGSAITSFLASDLIDLTDIRSATASVVYNAGTQTPGSLVITDGTRAATITLSFAAGLPPGFFTTASDGAAGTVVRYTTIATDADTFTATPGGAYGTAGNWQDTTTGTIAAIGPSYGNSATIAGTTVYTNVTGNGFAASLVTSGDVLQWGTIAVGTKVAGVTGNLTQTGTFALDGTANLSLAGTAYVSGLIEIGGGSTLTAAGGLSFTTNGAGLSAIDGGSAQFASVYPANPTQYDPSIITVDSNSRIEFGTTGSVVSGALTIDQGTTVSLGGTIDGNLVVNGTLNVAGLLSIAPLGQAAPSVSGTGTLVVSPNTTLSLAGPDSAAILFSQSNAIIGGTLALGTALPTGTISGFTPGDTITVGLIVTNLSWNGSRLTLLNGGVTVGSLVLSGTYTTSQFQVQLAANGLSSVITCAPAPSTTGGNTVSGNTDAYSWNPITGGTWSNAANWTDSTTGAPSTTAPGAGNAVTISSPSATGFSQIIAGPGAAASLTIGSTRSTIFSGSFAITGLFSMNASVALVGGSNLTAGSLSDSSLLRLAGASLLTVLGTSSGTFISGELAVGSGSAVRITGGASEVTGTVAVDSTSSVEVGTAGTATNGTMAIDNGQTVTLQGSANIAANVVLNGTLQVYSATIGGFGGTTGTITGNGAISLGALGPSGYLILNATDNDPITFLPYIVNGVGVAFETLELRSPVRTGVISGFLAGDAIILDRYVTAAVFTQTTANQGTLTLTNGTATVGTLTLNGNYAASLFQVDVAPATGVASITLQPATSTASAGSPGVTNDTLNWTGASGGSWSTASNWQDLNTLTTTTVPDSLILVRIAGTNSTNQYTTVGGNGATDDLAITGKVLLTGQITDNGWFQIVSGPSGPATLALESGAQLNASGGAEIYGTLEVGGRSVVTITGGAEMAGGTMLAFGGSTVQAADMVANGSNNIIAVDQSSIIRLGIVATYTPAGALTVAGAVPAITGTVYGSVVDNGWIFVDAGGSLFIDMAAQAESDPYAIAPTITGAGVLYLLEGSRLGLGVSDSAAIQFFGPNATLELVTFPTAAISGFVAGDQIQIDQAVTGLAYQQVTANSATLTLTNGAATVGVLNLAGSYSAANQAFHLDTTPNSDTAVITLQSLLLAPTQPAVIEGWGGMDLLTATSNNQTIIGGGGGDTINGAGFGGINFADYTSDFSGYTIQNFNSSDVIQFRDMQPGTASATYANGVVSVTDGSHAATFNLAFTTTPTSGSFHPSSDGSSGTVFTWH